MRPTVEIEGCRRSHRVLLDRLAGLTEDAVRQPSLLPGWSVAHVLAHIARNADSVVRRLQGAIDDRMVDQYAGGKHGRAAEIDESAARPADDLLDDVRSTAAAVDGIIERVPDDAWGRLSRTVGGDERPADYVVWTRWREVETHHVDLGLGYRPAQWPDPLVTRWLAEVLPALPDRADPRELLAWALGRGAPPELGPWG